MKKLTEAELSKLNAVGDYFGRVEIVKVNDIELSYHPQSPESAVKMMMIVGDLMKNSSDLKEIIIKFFPQLESVYDKINYLTLVELVGIITQKMLMSSSTSTDEK